MDVYLGTNAAGSTNPGSGTETHLNRFDDNGRLLFQRVWDAGAQGKTDTNYQGGYDAAGNLKSYSVFDYASNATNSYQMALDRRETYQQTSTSGSGTRSQPGASHSQYDVNGNLTAITDDRLPSNNRTLVNDISGKALQVSQSGNVQRQMIVGGEVLARYGVGIDELNPRDNNGNPNFAPISNSASSLTGILPGYVRSGADFNFGYQPINGNYPSASVGSYQVATGDTLQSIAQGAYGDSSLWYRIADANGLSGNSDLRVGQTLSIPNRVGSVHNYGAHSAVGGASGTGSFKPYDPSKVQGDTTPHLLPAPSDGGGGGCGGLGAIIVAIVVIVVAVVSQQYYLAGEGASIVAGGEAASLYTTAELAAVGAASPGASIAAGAIGGALGSAAGQIVGNLVGTQDGFSWKGVALGAISGGVSGGLGGVDFTGGAMSNAIVRAAVGNAMTQGIAVATGLQAKFSWKGVAAAVGAGVGYGVGQALGADAPLPDGQQGPLRPAAFAQFGQAGQIARASLTGLAAGLSTAVARGGRVNAIQIATDAFGNALGSSWGEQINASVQEGKLAQVNAENQREMNRFASGAQANAAHASSNRFAAIDAMAAASAGYEFTPDMSPENAKALRQTMGLNVNDLNEPVLVAAGDGFSMGRYRRADGARLDVSPWSPDGKEMSIEELEAQIKGTLAHEARQKAAARERANTQLGLKLDRQSPIRPGSYGDEMPFDVGYVDNTMPPPGASSGTGLSLGSRTGFNLQTSGQGLYTNGGPLDNFGRGFSGGNSWSVLEGDQPISYTIGSGLRSGLGLFVGEEDFHQAGQAWQRGEYGSASMYALRGTGAAALTVATAGQFALAKAGMSGVVGGTGLRVSTYSGDVFATDFVGPRKFEVFYRGDETLRREFLSSMAQKEGLSKADSFLSSLDKPSFDIRMKNHSLTSDGSALISTTKDRRVAEYFARGENQIQQGFVTEFRVPAGNQANAFRYNEFSEFNRRTNIKIGLPEQEFVVRGRIDTRYIYDQYRVSPK